MDEPARLLCPHCELVYRVKRITPGRSYVCKSCGGPLRAADAPAAPGRNGPKAQAFADAPASDLARLPKLIEKLTAHLDAIRELDVEAAPDSPAARLLETVSRLEEALGGKIRALDEKVENAFRENPAEKLGEELDEKLDGRLRAVADDIAGRLAALDEKVAAAAEKPGIAPEELASLRSDLESGRADLLLRQTELLGQLENRLGERLEERHEAQKMELSALLAQPDDPGKTTVEVDIDELADRLVVGVRGRGPMYDAETGSAVDALARLADQLVKEQNANTARLDKLAAEIHDAIANISKLEEWQSELPDRVADEIGATVEARVVGPISGALARQAPSILSELQDSKLVDIVSRSVREAQRPLLREILAGGRNGVPVWLFASVLLPLLLILGYLFLPGEFGGMGRAVGGASAEVSDALARIETSGVPLAPDAEDRLAGIEEAVLDIHNQALAHVKNAAALEEEVKSLRRSLEERDAIIAEYTTTLERQTKRLQAYEFRLVQLGVKPDAVAGQ